MNIYVIVALVALMSAVRVPLGEPAHTVDRFLAAGLYVACVSLLSFAMAAFAIYRFDARPEKRQKTLTAYRRGQFVQQCLSLAGVIALSVWCKWPSAASAFAMHWVLLENVVAALPFVMGELLSIAAASWVDSKIRVTNGPNESSSSLGFPTPWAYMDFHMRFQLGIPLASILAVSTFSRLVMSVQWIDHQTLGPFLWVGQTALLLFVAPWVLRFVLGAGPLTAGRLRTLLTTAARRAKLRFTDFLVWRTSHSMLNAAAPASLIWPKYIIFTDALLDKLSDEEIIAVMGHEAGHLHHRHIGFMAIVFSASAAVAVLLSPWVSWLVLKVSPEMVRGWFELAFRYVPPALVIFPAWMFFTFGPIWRLLERQADVFGARVASTALNAEENSKTRQATELGAAVCANALENTNRWSGRSRWEFDWRHGSIATRVSFLLAVAADPLLADRFDYSCARIKWAIVLTLASAIAALVFIGPAPGQTSVAAAFTQSVGF